VWTPKRIVILVSAFVAFAAVYLVYAYFLGGINGLPPLPEAYGPALASSDGPPPALPPIPENNAERLLRTAFGAVYDEVKSYKIKIELQSRGMVLATKELEIIEHGRVKLQPFCLATFRKAAGTDCPEINTIKCNQAILEFDRPVSSLADMSNRKIIAGTLRDDIYVINNRHTPDPGDDISLFTQGPLEYVEEKHAIWTAADVRLTDPHGKDEPTIITGVGMDIDLAFEEQPARPAAPAKPRSARPRQRTETPTGVKQIHLRKDVAMHLSVDGRSGFLGTSQPASKPVREKPRASATSARPAEAAGDEQTKVHITTEGDFEYDLTTDHARFNRLLTKSGSLVDVLRKNQTTGKDDELTCDVLDIQFQRRNSAAPAGANSADAEGGLDMENARARGRQVVLHSEAECLDAYGTDFFYDRRAHVTTLQGSPMKAFKEGSEIEAPELQLEEVQGGQQATAHGEGRIRMLDKATGKRTGTASWKKQMVYGREGPLDVMILVGDARFEDPEHQQDLSADLLKVWLEPSETASAAASNEHSRKPHHLEAVGRVRAVAPEMRVFDTERLVIQFHDAPPAAGGQFPSRLPEPASSRSGPASITLGGPQADNGSSRSDRNGKTTGGDQAKHKPPIDVSARLINADAIRMGPKTDLDKVRCEGSVRVHQEPSSPEDRGVDIQGEMLDLTHKLDGNILVVRGDHAKVQMNQLFILGPEIHIDQTSNEAWVHGVGTMRMPSKSNLDGTPLNRETELTINWQKDMYFNGQSAQFRGGVRASQDNGHLACDAMTVDLDRKVSLREGDRASQPARVQQLVCRNDVWVEDRTFRDKVLVNSSLLSCPELVLDNDNDPPGEKTTSKVRAGGPGQVRLFRLGAKDNFYGDSQPASNRNASPKKEEEFKLTIVRYADRMYADNGSGVARFYGHVLAVHVPTNNPDLRIDPNKPPPNFMMLTCERLEVLKLKKADGTSLQVMTAYQKVLIEGPDFSGSADVMKYDESKDLIVLIGSQGSPALLEKWKSPGSPRDRMRGDTILYSPKTGEYHLDHGSVLEIGR
jgi:hypothetical protein